MTSEQEKKMLSLMIEMYEKGKKEDLSALKEYAFKRIDYCPRKEEKTFCSTCPIHCYAPKYRQLIKEVMRYSGPRMIYKHPIIAIKHMVDTIKDKIKQKL